jgi:hypothetical protein
MPGVLIAHRRAVCTITGGLIALLIHLDALRRHKRTRSEISSRPGSAVATGDS